MPQRSQKAHGTMQRSRRGTESLQPEDESCWALKVNIFACTPTGPPAFGSDLSAIFFPPPLQKPYKTMKHSFQCCESQSSNASPSTKNRVWPLKPEFIQQADLLNRFSLASRPFPTLGKVKFIFVLNTK